MNKFCCFLVFVYSLPCPFSWVSLAGHLQLNRHLYRASAVCEAVAPLLQCKDVTMAPSLSTGCLWFTRRLKTRKQTWTVLGRTEQGQDGGVKEGLNELRRGQEIRKHFIREVGHRGWVVWRSANRLWARIAPGRRVLIWIISVRIPWQWKGWFRATFWRASICPLSPQTHPGVSLGVLNKTQSWAWLIRISADKKYF